MIAGKLLVCLVFPVALAALATGCSDSPAPLSSPTPAASPAPPTTSTPAATPAPVPDDATALSPAPVPDDATALSPAPVPDGTTAPTPTPTPPSAPVIPVPTSTATPVPTPSPDPVGPSAGVGDSFYPLLGNGGYDVLHYHIDLDVAPSANALDGVTTLTAVATDDLGAFNLDFHGLEVEAVAVDGVEVEFSRDGSEMTVRPAAAISSGAQFTVAVSYSGTPQPIADPNVPFASLGWQTANGVIYTVSQPSGAMTWYPNNNHPADKATFTFRITVPDGATAAATGLLADETSADGQTTTTWHMDDPMATYLAAVYIGDFERREHRLADGLLVRDYVPRGADPSMLGDLAVAPRAIVFFEEILGPYPFDAYGTIVMPFPLGFALENQTLSIHGLFGLDPYIIAHEVAHQWVGNSATVDDWSQIWLHEGFAHYLGLLFVADFYGRDIESTMAREHRDLVLAGTSPPGHIEAHELFDPNTVYRRGALALHALRTLVGDETFFDILGTHYGQAAGGNTNTGLFLGIVGDLAGSGAVSLVESWLYNPEMPGIVSGPTP